jgi:hypothetical protein
MRVRGLFPCINNMPGNSVVVGGGFGRSSAGLGGNPANCRADSGACSIPVALARSTSATVWLKPRDGKNDARNWKAAYPPPRASTWNGTAGQALGRFCRQRRFKPHPGRLRTRLHLQFPPPGRLVLNQPLHFFWMESVWIPPMKPLKRGGVTGSPLFRRCAGRSPIC